MRTEDVRLSEKLNIVLKDLNYIEDLIRENYGACKMLNDVNSV